MKKLLLILSVILFISCSNDDEPCMCMGVFKIIDDDTPFYTPIECDYVSRLNKSVAPNPYYSLPLSKYKDYAKDVIFIRCEY